MTNYLNLLLDLLNLEEEERQSFLAIGEIIANHKNKSLTIHHRMGFIFQARSDLLLEKISLEEFLATGDVLSTHPIYPSTTSSLDLLQSSSNLKKIEKDSLLLLDEISFLSLSKHQQDEVQDITEKRGILLLLC